VLSQTCPNMSPSAHAPTGASRWKAKRKVFDAVKTSRPEMLRCVPSPPRRRARSYGRSGFACSTGYRRAGPRAARAHAGHARRWFCCHIPAVPVDQATEQQMALRRLAASG
jgi:hypothetical protein